jgi:hypothetical protein
LRLQVQLDFPGQCFPSPEKRFPFEPPAAASPQAGLDYHLVHTIIPNVPEYSLGVFLCGLADS